MSPRVQHSAPPYRQVVEHLREQIVRGDLAEGDRLPSAKALADEWGISVATAYKALGALRSLGLVETHTGVGTTVRPLAPGWTDSVDADSFVTPHERHEHMRRTGKVRSPGELATLLINDVRSPPPDVRRALSLARGESAICRERVASVDGRPTELSTSWFSGALEAPCPRLLGEDQIPEGTTRYVERRLNITAERIDETDVATLATERDAGLLGIEPSTPIITTQVVIRTADSPLVFEVYRYPGPRPRSYSITPP